eukprot:6139528-Lingulodinium_polyedra.AAC.1
MAGPPGQYGQNARGRAMNTRENTGNRGHKHCCTGTKITGRMFENENYGNLIKKITIAIMAVMCSAT